MRKPHLIFRWMAVLLLLCIFSNIDAQVPLQQSPVYLRADSLWRAKKTDEALAGLTAARADLDSRGSQGSPDYVAVLFTLGNHFLLNRNPREGAGALQAALDLHREVSPRDVENQIELLAALGACYSGFDPRQAVTFYDQALALRLQVSGERSRSAAKGYYELALIHIGINFEKATEYCLKAIRCLRYAGLTHDPDYGGYHQVLGLICQEEGDYAEALKYYRQAADTLRTYLGDHKDTGVCLATLGETYARLGQLDEALECQQAAVAMLERVDTTSRRYLRAACYGLGITYNLANQPLFALRYLRRSQYFGAKPGASVPAGARLSIHLSESYCLLGDHDHALACADTALAGLKTAQGHGRLYYWQAMLTKARAMAGQFQQKKNTPALLEAGELLAEAHAIMSSLIGSFDNNRSKMAVYREYLQEFDRTIAIYTQLADATADPIWLRRAFEFSETGKGLLQYIQVQENKSRRRAAVPDALAGEEKRLHDQLTALRKQLYETGEATVSAQADSLREQLFDLNRRYEAVQKAIQAIAPGFFAADASLPVLQLDSLQARLRPGEGLLEFFAGDSTFTAFLLRADTLVFFKISAKKAVENDIALLRDAMTRYFISPQKNADRYLLAANDYAGAACRLYQTLLAPFGALLPERLTIVPDGALAYLPFEALLVEKPIRADRFHLHHYVANDKTLRYACSAALLREMENLSRTPAPPRSGSVLALAPFFDQTTAWSDSLLALRMRSGQPELAPLPYSGEEVFKVAQLTGGKTRIGAEATKAAFQGEVAQYPVLHLATHARANDLAGDYSYLVFAPDAGRPNTERLYVSEIYDLSLNAELVTLSACETGLGPMLRGEGIVSIARAFASAGARSIVQSQWAVNDAQTRRLMEFFYQNLKSGQPKDQALRNARAEYLRRGEQAHPYFWAGFILIGDNAPLRFF